MLPPRRALADREGVSSIYAGQILPLAYLAPDLVEVILAGPQPPRLTLAALIDRALPRDWTDQRALFSAFA